MSGCSDKRFENMLHAYELDLLDENEQFDFEVHLYNCDSCFKKVEQFQKTAAHLQHSAKVIDTIEKVANSKPADAEKPGTTKRLWPTLVPISIAALFFVFLILKDWQFDIQPSKEAIAAENRLAIMYFDNLSDPSDSLKLGEIATNLLIADLSESSYLNLVSSQHLADILNRLDMEGAKSISNNAASKIADEAKAKWLLTGNILATSPNIIITTQLLEVATGDILASQKMEGTSDDNIFSIIDKLTIHIKNNLSLPSEALMEPDPEIADYTTYSPQAYRHYLDGIENYNKMYFAEAKNDFELALKYDSTFAMAYYYLARISGPELIHKAVEYADGAGTIDRFYIKYLEAINAGDKILSEKLLQEIIKQYPEEKNAYYLLGILKYQQLDYENSIEYLHKAIMIDPQFKMAYNHLAYTYNWYGNFEKALWAIDKYIELAPDEANPLDTKAEIYALNGMLDNAIESYKRALIVKPDFYASLRNLGLMYMFKKEYSRADSCLDIILASQDSSQWESALRYKCYIPQFQGKLDDALNTIDDIIASFDKNPYNFHFIKSLINITKKDWTLALENIEKAIEFHDIDWPDDKISYRYFRIYILAEGGNIDRAIKLAGELKEHIETTGKSEYSYWYADGSIAMSLGDFERAITSFNKSRESQNMFFTSYRLADAYLMAERYDESIYELEKLCNSYSLSRGYYTIWSTMLHYNLGLAYEQSGQHKKAIEQYSIFLNLWKNADKGIESIKDAEERLNRLKSIS